MISYLIRRFFQSVIVLFVVTLFAFALVRMAPGNPARLLLHDDASDEMVAAMEARLGLDKPLPVQFFNYIAGVLRGDLGTSIVYGQPISRIIAARLPTTIILAVGTVIVGCLLAIPLGIIAGVKRGSIIDFFSLLFALLFQSMANIWVAIMLIFIFAVSLGWLPALGASSLQHFILPVITLGTSMAAILARVARSGMADVLSEDYITTTYARGIGRFKVNTKYALRNALIPVITIIGINLGTYLAGSVVIETVFAMGGIGQLLNQSISSRDYVAVQSLLLISAFLFTAINFLVDVVNSIIDPRLSFYNR